MEKAPMPKWLKIVIAIVACAIVIIGYSVLSATLGFKHGGGYFILILLFSLLGGIWRAIVGSGKDKESDSIKEGDAIASNTQVIKETAAEDSINPMDNVVYEPPKESPVESSAKTNTEDSPAPKPDYHIVLKVLLLIFMIIGVIVMIYQAINDFTWENYTVGWIRLVSGLIGLGGFILLYMKKLSGYIIIVSVLLFGIVYSAIMHDSNIGMVISASFFRLLAISLFLLIRKDGVSGWSILLHRHSGTLNEIKETFPVKPFMYIEKVPEEKPQETQHTTNNFENWLNS